MRVFKKISTPFTNAKATHAIIVINAVDPQINTIKAFIQACLDNKIRFVAVINKIDKVYDKKGTIKTIEEELNTFGIDGISAYTGENFEVIHGRLKTWQNGKIIILGVFNSGKTSLINRACKTKYKVGDIPGTTLEFTETKYEKNTILIDSVGQLIDIHKPMMVSIDFSKCGTIDEKIDMVFKEEIQGIVKTKETINKNMKEVVKQIIKQIKEGNKIIVTGAGASALVAKEIAGQGTECGFPILVFTNDGSEVQPITFSKGIAEAEGGISKYISYVINSGDVVIGVSASGGTGFVFDTLRRAKEIGAVTIAITENLDTPLGMTSDYILKSDAKPEGPSSSKIQTAHLVIGHTLMLVLADEFGVTADESVGHMLPETLNNKKMGIK